MTEIASMVITHAKACVEEMECALHDHDLEDILKHLHSQEHIEECVVLKTCNRVEIYVVSSEGINVLAQFAEEMGIPSRIVEFHEHDDSLDHLLRLACGLESMIVGEDQILGQIKELYLTAKKAGATGQILDTAFRKATQVGKRVRNETNINKGAVSIGSAAVDLAEEIIGNLRGKRILVIGAGEMGTLVARALTNREIDVIYIANRTFKRAQILASELGGMAVPYDYVRDCIKSADVVISATAAPHYVLTKNIVEQAMKEREQPLLLIDIANPRDIEDDVGDIPNVNLHNIDSLRVINEKNIRMRMEEAKKAEILIKQERELLDIQYKRQKADGIISKLYSELYSVRENEKTRAINRLSAYHTIGEIETSVIDDLTHALVNKILAEPTKVLRAAAENGDDELLESVCRLFDVDTENK
ncbi:glutamyl-tRNA reductase [Methanosalsum zhilinae DSM 4017]|uniref:Glutamyl-tRNA reductase n=1 Tax=Methanosalsum zhilinae (strain DSM 4017 / NBRC 107636 / OCM 62 / WeN5) TaxID=679901 RepID=F7XP41_METZD|nr:glutamyl-tRNA reductase [Methanosalsum zhilinae]AEH61333.1 glutamyl-tRNA reductase [Methanosalsum zhilinae DSM 4017]